MKRTKNEGMKKKLCAAFHWGFPLNVLSIGRLLLLLRKKYYGDCYRQEQQLGCEENTRIFNMA
jgi:hypothetical protein